MESWSVGGVRQKGKGGQEVRNIENVYVEWGFLTFVSATINWE